VRGAIAHASRLFVFAIAVLTLTGCSSSTPTTPAPTPTSTPTTPTTPTPTPTPTLITFDIIGVVHESAPTEDVALSGATVGVHFVGCPTCPHDNQTTVTDGAGHFALQGIETAGFSLVVSKQGYETTSYNIAQLPRDQHPDISLIPDLAMVRVIFEGVFQPSECSGFFSCNRDFTFPVHHQGAIIIEECNSDSFDNYESSLYLGIPPRVPPDALEGPPRLAGGHCLTSYPDKGGYSWQADPGFTYTLRVIGDQGKRFRAIFTHPN
jgi:hypothetical protein